MNYIYYDYFQYLIKLLLLGKRNPYLISVSYNQSLTHFVHYITVTELFCDVFIEFLAYFNYIFQYL